MEGILVLVVMIGMWWAFSFVVSAGARTVRATGRSVMGKGSLAENMELEFKGIPAFQTRIQAGRVGDDGDGPLAVEIEARGLFPVDRTTQVGFITSIFDATDGELKPVISLIDSFQEARSTVYQHNVGVGGVAPNQGFTGWVRVGVALPEIIQPPRTGRRKLRIVTRMVDTSNPPQIMNGFSLVADHPGLLWSGGHDYEFDSEIPGYEEESENHAEAQSLGVKVALAVAMSDGNLDDTEGEILRDWIVRTIAPFPEAKQPGLKQLFNTAMVEGFAEAERGELSLSALTERMNEISDRSTKYETIELCFDVMAADGVAHPEELKLIRRVAEALELDYDEIQRLRDHRIVGLGSSLSDDDTDTDDLLGISPDWSREQTLTHIRQDYQKWSNRLNVLPEGPERENAQQMLGLLASARRKYDGASAP